MDLWNNALLFVDKIRRQEMEHVNTNTLDVNSTNLIIMGKLQFVRKSLRQPHNNLLPPLHRAIISNPGPRLTWPDSNQISGRAGPKQCTGWMGQIDVRLLIASEDARKLNHHPRPTFWMRTVWLVERGNKKSMAHCQRPTWPTCPDSAVA